MWQNFYQLTQIPRPSHHEEQVRDFLAQFGKDLARSPAVSELKRSPSHFAFDSRPTCV